MNRYFKLVLEKGIEYNDILSNYFILNYKIIGLSHDFRNFIEESIEQKKDFELGVLDMKMIIELLDLKIPELLKHDDFNPFKEELRRRFPKQYGSQPFVYEGITYYLYNKGREFYIDSLICSTLSFKELLVEHIKINKPLKYVYKEI